MTGEEMERAIEFILHNQVSLEEHVKQAEQRIEQVNRNLSEQIAELNRTVQLMATSQSQFNEMMTTTVVSLADSQRKLEESHQKLAESQRELTESQRELSESQRHTEQKLDALIDIVRERFEGKDGAA